MPLTVGTAGHIDHGKTWLVRALTGKDTDRLPEERERGISIDLGYAPLELPDGRRMSLVDVPGHERFVRTMIAGATGIDLFLLVIDAHEGARPQTHEHLAVLRLLGIDRGVVAVTKADAVDEETLELALEEARELVPGAEVVGVSAKTGAGLDELRAALARVGVDGRDGGRATRLYVDRVFTIQGIGTIVTGTLWSGAIAAGDVLRVEPSGAAARVRSVQVHDAAVERAEAGQRVALNLPALERGALARGDVLVEPGHYPLSYRLDVRLTELEPVPAAVTVHVGTKAVAARVAREGDYAQLRLAEPVVAARGDHVVLRTATTVGGGVVLDPAPPRGLAAERLAVLERGDPEEIVRALVHEPATERELQARGVLAPHELARGLAGVRAAGDVYFSEAWLDELRGRVRARLEEHAQANPLDPGIAVAELLPPAVGAGDREPARAGAPRRDGVPPRGRGPARQPRRGGVGAAGRARRGRRREGRRRRARSVPRAAGQAGARRRRLRGRAGALRARARRARDARADHAAGLPRRARDLAPHGTAPARALRHRWADAPYRRPPRAAGRRTPARVTVSDG